METLYFMLNVIEIVNTNSFDEQLVTAALIVIFTMPLIVMAGKMILKELTEV